MTRHSFRSGVPKHQVCLFSRGMVHNDFFPSAIKELESPQLVEMDICVKSHITISGITRRVKEVGVCHDVLSFDDDC